MHKSFITLFQAATLAAVLLFKCTLASSKPCSNNHLTMSILWTRASGEIEALRHQAYNTASDRILLRRALGEISEADAIVVDIDETVLDSSDFQSRVVLDELAWPEEWEEYLINDRASAIEGAIEFLNLANSMGIKIFYITNRKEKFSDATVRNLRELNIPQIEADHLFFRTGSRSKSERRKTISAHYNIIMLIGDSLQDFDNIFENESNQEIKEAVASRKYDFGRRFIVLPNSIYGNWEDNIYEGRWDLSGDELNEKRLKAIKESLKND